MRWLLSTELRNKVLSGSPTRASRVCMTTERRARMGSTRGKSLSASSWECCPHRLHTSARVVSERGLGGNQNATKCFLKRLLLLTTTIMILGLGGGGRVTPNSCSLGGNGD